jgi:hypothetical protein
MNISGFCDQFLPEKYFTIYLSPRTEFFSHMTARPHDPESRRRPLRIVVALVLVMVAVLLAAGCVSQPQTATDPAGTSAGHEGVLLEFPGSTTIIAQGVTSVSDLAAKGVGNPESLNIPGGINNPNGIKRFDLVTFNHPALNGKLKSGQRFPVRIRGTEYLANVTRMTFDKNDDGIDSYHGGLDGEKSSEILITVSSKVIMGSISVTPGETLWIEPVENRSRGEKSLYPLHMIYSSKDVAAHRYRID